MRDRLIELLDECRGIEGIGMELVEKQADYLLENGVIVPPCNVGDKVYIHFAYDVISVSVEKIEITERGCFFGTEGGFFWRNFDDIDKTVFLTREQAEKALAEVANDSTRT